MRLPLSFRKGVYCKGESTTLGIFVLTLYHTLCKRNSGPLLLCFKWLLFTPFVFSLLSLSDYKTSCPKEAGSLLSRYSYELLT